VPFGESNTIYDKVSLVEKRDLHTLSVEFEDGALVGLCDFLAKPFPEIRVLHLDIGTNRLDTEFIEEIHLQKWMKCCHLTRLEVFGASLVDGRLKTLLKAWPHLHRLALLDNPLAPFIASYQSSIIDLKQDQFPGGLTLGCLESITACLENLESLAISLIVTPTSELTVPSHRFGDLKSLKFISLFFSKLRASLCMKLQIHRLPPGTVHFQQYSPEVDSSFRRWIAIRGDEGDKTY
jgi:hypothetical protein